MPNELLTVDQALGIITQQGAPIGDTPLALGQALGRVLARDAVSDVDSPPHHKAMMDGYAVVAGDPAEERVVVEEVMAGALPTKQVSAGSATRIMTGAPMPVGADAVVPVEQTQVTDSRTVRLPVPGPDPGKHVMPRGEAIQKGETILTAPVRLNAAHVALLAETGNATPSVACRPTVGVLATGDELVDASQSPAAGQIRNSNGPMLLTLAREAHSTPHDLGAARDSADSLRQHILAGRDCQVLLLSGGVSAGDRDLTPDVLSELGVQRVFHKVAVRPGKPLWFGLWPGDQGAVTYVFGLPGNPVSGYVCFQLFVRPLLGVLEGLAPEGLPRAAAVLTEDVANRSGRESYLPALASVGGEGQWLVRPTAWRGSADLAGLGSANALLKIPSNSMHAPAGQRVEILLTGPR